MCGIAGFINFEGHDLDEARARVRMMTDALIHRGPDAEGQTEVLVRSRVHGFIGNLKRACRLVPCAGHVDAALLRQAYHWLKRDAAPGVVCRAAFSARSSASARRSIAASVAARGELRPGGAPNRRRTPG